MTLITVSGLVVYKYYPELLGLKGEEAEDEKPDVIVSVSQSEIDGLKSEMEKYLRLYEAEKAKSDLAKSLNDSVVGQENKLRDLLDSLTNKVETITHLEEKQSLLNDSLETLNSDVVALKKENGSFSTQMDKMKAGFRNAEDSLSQENLKDFAKLYNNTEPKDVAAIIDNIPNEKAAIILKSMNKKKAGKVIENLKPDKAAAIMLLGFKQEARTSPNAQ
ncbi:MAG: hypothetical protein Kapaf2KO_20320 [Candidatus Kapaibacteriales bacterium]